MILFIRVENGQPVDHPVADWNLMQVFGEIPSNYEPFIRTQKPEPGTYEVEDLEAPLYGKDADGAWTDLWAVRPMNPEERAAKEAEIMANLERIHAHLIQMSEDNVANAKDEQAKQVVLDYIEELRSLVLTPDESFEFPQPPHIRLNGELMPPIDVAGTTPDVIG